MKENWNQGILIWNSLYLNIDILAFHNFEFQLKSLAFSHNEMSHTFFFIWRHSNPNLLLSVFILVVFQFLIPFRRGRLYYRNTGLFTSEFGAFFRFWTLFCSKINIERSMFSQETPAGNNNKREISKTELVADCLVHTNKNQKQQNRITTTLHLNNRGPEYQEKRSRKGEERDAWNGSSDGLIVTVSADLDCKERDKKPQWYLTFRSEFERGFNCFDAFLNCSIHHPGESQSTKLTVALQRRTKKVAVSIEKFDPQNIEDQIRRRCCPVKHDDAR